MKKMGTLFILGLALFPVLSHAATIAELQAQLTQLMAQVAALQSQQTTTAAPPSSGQANVAAPTTSCLNLSRNLSRGMKGSDVTQLQQFLISQNLLAADSATGFFGAMTESAVKQWQCQKMSICTGSPATNGYGAVGPKTRAALTKCTPTISVTPTTPPTPPIPATPIVPTNPTTPSTPINPSTPVSCTPLSAQTQTLSCPTGQTGSITQTRTSSCATGATSPTWSAWATTTNTCAVNVVVPTATQISAAGSQLAQATQFQTLVTAQPVMREIFVDANGSDAGNGSSSNPYRTIARARDAAREYRANMTGNIVISIRGDGRKYFMDQPLSLTANDSGMNGYYVVYRGTGAPPLITGGVELGASSAAWSIAVAGHAFYQRPLGGVVAGTPRHAYMNGERATRARTPDLSTSCTMTSAGNFSCPTLIPESYTSRDGIEAVSYRHWRSFRCPVTVTNVGDQNAVRLSDNCSYLSSAAHLQDSFSMNDIKWLENSIVFLDQPNEWHVRDGMLYYYPSGSSIGDVTTTIPTKQTLITLNGASNVAFTNLAFAYTSWSGPNDSFGFVEHQAGHRFDHASGAWVVRSAPAAVSCSSCTSVVFADSTFEHLGANAIEFVAGTNKSAVFNSTLRDISGTAVYVGGIDGAQDGLNSTRATWHNIVEKNRISDVGKEFFGSPGIFVGYAGYTEIIGNTLSNLPYSGISVGWGWTDQPVRNLRSNTVSANTITNVMQKLSDGAAIYINSNQRGESNNQQRTVINRNTVNGVGNSVAGHFSAGIYLDNGASFVSLVGNVLSGLVQSSSAYFFSPGGGGVPGASDYIQQ